MVNSVRRAVVRSARAARDNVRLVYMCADIASALGVRCALGLPVRLVRDVR